MIVRAEPLWEQGESEEEDVLKWLVCVEYPSGAEECFKVRQLFINGKLEKDPSYTVYFFEAAEVRVAEEDEADIKVRSRDAEESEKGGE
jgi:hypothetical protein